MLKMIENNFSLFIALAFIVGLLLPDVAKGINPYILYILMGVMYFTILKIDIKELTKTASAPIYLVYLSFIVLIVLPIYCYAITKVVYPSLAIPALIVGTLPAAMASTAYTDLLKGNVHITLLVTILTSLIAPLTMPFFVKLLIGVETQASYLEMLLMLAQAILVPFILALFTKRWAKKIIDNTVQYYSVINIGLLFLVIVGPVGSNAEFILNDPMESVKASFYFILLMATFHIIGWYASWWRPLKDIIASTTSISYCNVTLGVVFAYKFFPDPVVVGIVLFEVAWNLMPLPFQVIVKKVNKSRQA